jgi:hypothetical protein
MHLFMALSLAATVLGTAAHAAAPPAPSQCTAASGERRVPLLELYTSEGCDSCPPTDKWLSELPAKGFGPDRVVALAYHVDYWDYIGWRDPYAQARFSERQRFVNARNGDKRIYTPQLMLNGRDYRRGNDIAQRLAQISATAPGASIRLSSSAGAAQLAVSGSWKPDATAGRTAQGWIAVYENRLATDVRAGENRGRRLQHDFVVRDLAGPLPAGDFTHTFALDSRWKRSDVGVAAFVIDARTGETLQALTLAGC